MPYDRSAFITRTPQEDIAFDYALEADMFIADKLFDPKPVSKSLTKVFQFDTSKLRVPETRKGTNSEADLIDEQLFSRDITLEEHKLGGEVNPRDVRDSDLPAMVGEARKVKLVTNALLLKRESLAATLATTTGNYPADLTSAIASGSRWNEAGGDPQSNMATVNAALRLRVGRNANALAIDVSTLDKLKLSPMFRDAVKYTTGGPVTEDAIKAFFGVEHLFVGRAHRDAEVEGAAATSIAGFWSDHAIAFVYNPSVGLEDCSYGHMYIMKEPFWTKTIEDPKRNGPAGPMKRVEVGTEYKLASGYVVSSSDTDFAGGYLLRTVVA